MHNLTKLRTHFDAGDLTGAIICPAPLEPGPAPCWIVIVKRQNGQQLVLKKDRAEQGQWRERIFKSLDAAFAACESIGFIQAKVIRK